MALWPVRGSRPWDNQLREYVDEGAATPEKVAESLEALDLPTSGSELTASIGPVAEDAAEAFLASNPGVAAAASSAAASAVPPAVATYLDGLDLDDTYATIGQAPRALQLIDEIRLGKFGKIGTAGKAVISLRYDHQLDPFRSTILPMLQARRLPFSMGVVTQSVGQPAGGPTGYEPTTTTWAQLQSDLLYWGGEIWSHSRTHGNPVNPATLADEIVGSKADIQTNLPKARVMGWQQPGGPSTYGVPHTSASGMDDLAGRLIRNTYGLYESSIVGSNYRGLPTFGCNGLNHITIDTFTLAAAKAVVDTAIDMKLGVQLMTHALFIGQSGMMSVADYGLLMDYLVQKRDEGKIEVLTASALAFADTSTDYRPSLVPAGDFESVTTATPPAAYFNPGAAWTIQSDGGHTGSNYLRIPAGQSNVIVRRPIAQMGLEGHPVMFEGWVRSLDGSPPNHRVYIRGAAHKTNGTNDTGRDFLGATTSSWQRVRYITTLPVGYNECFITFGKAAGTGTVDWDDVRCVPI